ncbi:MAG: YfcE family phosphodiesterase [Gemmatales bacterium]|nr:YfcE family phosphodiesterase [Gemmatales bacterium]MCS7160994.1 YfcE family phosphodiesterase [Gemmatales bacterium]MDW8176197.1 YfcE family phosphodiesterase [Gemmatales bacterium]MDW8223745.1 YfcE family phosphodiesterase [Gemmatales bacterium]
MLVGVISDTHGNQVAVAAALRLLQARQPECVIHCGDIDDVSTMQLFRGIQLHLVLGNCDPPENRLHDVARQLGFHYHGRVGRLELGGNRLVFLHGDDRQRLDYVIRSGAYDIVLHGHTHQRRCVLLGSTWVVNPGALVRVAQPTIALIHLPSRRVEFLEVAVS